MPWPDSALAGALPSLMWTVAAFAHGPWWVGVCAAVATFPIQVTLARLRVLGSHARTSGLSANEWIAAIALASAALILPGTAFAIVFLRRHESWLWWSLPRFVHRREHTDDWSPYDDDH
jgi:hypothetical protein